MSNMYWLLAAVFILGAERAGSETQGFCDFDASSRVNCGNERTSYDTCKSNGCCYDSSKMGYIWCFQPWSVKDRICNYNNPSARANCGMEGINEQKCTKENDCCYDEKTSGVPSCFPKDLIAEKPTCNPNNRVNCAYPNVTLEACLRLKCCFDNSTLGKPYCYNTEKKNDVSYCALNTCLLSRNFSGTPCITEGSSSLLATVTVTCNVATSEKVNCGMDGISKDTCRNKDCCYYETPTGPWCYKMKITG
uniref:P-type domain-containing protein n=1 Tax=Leptobrachium leishanense TaxID=445787 RepID=A0A8C5LTE1_9ANUR